MTQTLRVVPGVSIGELKLGMTPAELNETAAGASLDCVCEFVGDQAVFIELPGFAAAEFRCSYADLDLFRTPAEELIPILDAGSPYRRDEDAELGFGYVFPEIGLSLWRSRIMREEDREADWYKEMPPENREDELRFRFFETAAVFSRDWPGLRAVPESEA